MISHFYDLRLRLKEETIGIGSVYRRVTQCARLVLLRLVMERWNCRSRGINRQRMAFKTKQVHVAALQQPRIRRTVRSVAPHATFPFPPPLLQPQRPSLALPPPKPNPV